MSFDWRGANDEVMEQNFNPRVAVTDTEALLEAFAARAARARETHPGEYDERFGDGANATLDVHRPADADGSRPLLMFIHGGYWRGLDKRDHSFVAPAFVDRGIAVANVNYDLCPTVTLDTIVEQMVAACRYCREHAQRWGARANSLVIMGHSAGAHLGAELLAHDWRAEGLDPGFITGVVALTGVYEPEVILHVSVNDEARISADVARRRNCLTRPPKASPAAVVAAGGDEPEGWIDQSARYADLCRASGLDTELQIVPGANHFTVLDRALDFEHPLGRRILDLFQPTF